MKISQLLYDPEDFGIFDYEWREDGKLDVFQSVDLSFRNLETSPFEFGFVKSLNLSYNNLTSLENIVENCEDLFVNKNQLTSLEGLPKIAKVIDVSSNPLSSVSQLSSIKGLEQVMLNYLNLSDWINIPIVDHLEINYSSIDALEAFKNKKIKSLSIKNSKISSVDSLFVEDFLYLRYSSNLSSLKGLGCRPKQIIITNCGQSESVLWEELNQMFPQNIKGHILKILK